MIKGRKITCSCERVSRKPYESNKLSRANTSGYKGVSEKKGFGWYATIRHKGVTKHLGVFESKKSAVIARQQAEVKYFGKMQTTWREVD